MMSPLSVAQFCDSAMIRFDVVVFDEASQIRPEDALGTLLRGKQAVIMGDTEQLPPTRFFDSIVEDTGADEDSDDPPIKDMESILHQCRGQYFTSRTLKWHYRSRHESLIAVSNQEFYDNKLTIFPSPVAEDERLGLKFAPLPDVIYDRGGSSTNREEAKAVVEAAFEHYRRDPDKSLGIGAFSTKQQQAILDEVEVQLRQNPEMEHFFSSSRREHFFVKNLETIQGDERDVIFVSIGYGKDSNGKLYQNFGPINQEGGHRRLNVLFTRARERCVVFSNFRASDLSLDENTRRGVKALKTFLNYAENGNLPSPDGPMGDTDSPFEDAVYEFLKSQNHEVKKQVGCAGYRIDLAVVDACAPGSYLLGIECDGAGYHSSSVARDRDRLRQQILEKLGWTIHRIWSTDWYHNPSEAKSRVRDAIARAESEKEKLPLPPPPSKPADPPNPSPPPKPPEPPPILDYEVCTDLGIPIRGELSHQPVSRLAKAVARIVEVEGPVHIDEVVFRFRDLWGLKRVTKRLKIAIEKATVHASGKIRMRGDFLWHGDEQVARVRRRSSRKIEWICDEEIAESMKLVLASQGRSRVRLS